MVVMKGNLRDMGIADLIQHNCQDRKTTQVSIEHSGQQAVLFFMDGNVVHAGLGDEAGEEVIYEILKWEDGTFETENNIAPPANSIRKSWSSLLLEGARRIDEKAGQTPTPALPKDSEVNPMATNLDSILKDMSGEINGYMASIVSGMDGINIAEHSKGGKVDTEAICAQMTMLFKLVDTATVKVAEAQGQAISVEDNLLNTEGAYVLMRYLPGRQYYVGVIVDRKAGNLGNLRLISRVYSDRLAKAMPG